MNDRTCIVTREGGSVDDMIRFVASPDGAVVADLKRNLPGRGCWVKAQRRYIDEAVKRKLFPRALKTNVTVPDDFGLVVEQMLVKFALGSFGLARKAGVVVTGAAKVDSAIRNGTAAMVLHAREAAEDGIRKLDQARRSVVYAGGPEIPEPLVETRDKAGQVAFGLGRVAIGIDLAPRAERRGPGGGVGSCRRDGAGPARRRHRGRSARSRRTSGGGTGRTPPARR